MYPWTQKDGTYYEGSANFIVLKIKKGDKVTVELYGSSCGEYLYCGTEYVIYTSLTGFLLYENKERKAVWWSILNLYYTHHYTK